jgi:kynurenine formamidase
MFLNHHLQLFLLLISFSCIKPIQLPSDPLFKELTYPINENTLHWITARSFHKNSSGGYRNAKLRDGSLIQYWYSTEDVSFNSHTGTHLDAPCHFAKDAWCVTDIPVEHLLDRPYYVMDVRFYVQHEEHGGGDDYQATVERFIDWFKGIDFKNGSVLFIFTSWSRKWPIKEDYFGIRKNDESRMHFPGISPELADHIVTLGKFVGVGIDGPSIDPGLSVDKDAHRKLFSNNIYVIENVPNMVGLQAFGQGKVTIAPMYVEGASGAPARLFVRSEAWDLPNEGRLGDGSGSHSNSASLLCLAMSLILLLLFNHISS